MATTNRDYYEVLGLARSADDGEIKRAFRRLARELHPDVSDAPDAEERFREVTEAYEVLSNSETRALYDRYGHEGLRSGGFRPTQFDMGGLSDLFSAFFGDDLFGAGGGTRRARGARRDVGGAVRGRRHVRDLRRRRRRAGHTADDLPALRGRRPAAAGLAQRLRRVRADAAVPAVLGPRRVDRASV